MKKSPFTKERMVKVESRPGRRGKRSHARLLRPVNAYIPMGSKIKNILSIVVVIAVVLWLLRIFGVLLGASALRIKR